MIGCPECRRKNVIKIPITAGYRYYCEDCGWTDTEIMEIKSNPVTGAEQPNELRLFNQTKINMKFDGVIASDAIDQINAVVKGKAYTNPILSEEAKGKAYANMLKELGVPTW